MITAILTPYIEKELDLVIEESEELTKAYYFEIIGLLNEIDIDEETKNKLENAVLLKSRSGSDFSFRKGLKIGVILGRVFK